MCMVVRLQPQQRLQDQPEQLFYDQPRAQLTCAVKASASRCSGTTSSSKLRPTMYALPRHMARVKRCRQDEAASPCCAPGAANAPRLRARESRADQLQNTEGGVNAAGHCMIETANFGNMERTLGSGNVIIICRYLLRYDLFYTR